MARDYTVRMINGQQAAVERAIVLTQLPSVTQYSANRPDALMPAASLLDNRVFCDLKNI